MNTVAFIPLRAGSKGIPGKNIKRMAGRPLFDWVTRAALSASGIDEVYISTDSPAIRDAALAMGEDRLHVFNRSAENATDTATTESAMIEFASQVTFDKVILIQATSPLLQSRDLEGGLAKLRETGADSLLSVARQKRFIWKEDSTLRFAEPVNYVPGCRPRRQEFDGYLVENGAFYICGRGGLLGSGCRLHGNVAVFEMDESSYTELDEPADWLFLESILNSRGLSSSSFRERAKRIRLFLTDVDGVLTDGGMYYSEKGDELKKFNTRDAVGMRLLQEAGLQVGFLTSEKTDLVAARAKKTNVDFVIQGARDKAGELDTLLAKTGYDASEVAFIGDDINDSGILSRVGLAATPADGRTAIRHLVHFVCQTRGGEGAVRELAESILQARG